MTNLNTTSGAQARDPVHLASFPQLNPHPVFELDAKGNLTYANPATFRVLEALGMDSSQVTAFVPVDLPGLFAQWDGQTTVSHHREVAIADRVFGETLNLISGSNAARVYAYDITEQKRAEQALRESEDRYFQLFQQGTIPASLTKLPENVFADVNAAFEQLLGYTRAELLGKTSLELGIARPQEHASTVSRLEQFGVQRDVDKHVYTKSGEVRIVSLNVTALELGGERYALSTLQDITERKRAEESLRVSEARFRFALANSPVVVSTLDRDLRYTWIYNPGSGFKPEDVLGKKVGLSTDAETRERILGLLHRVLDEGASVQWENASSSASGSRTFESHAEPLRDANGAITGVNLISLDVTDRKRAEKFSRALHALDTVVHSTLHLDEIMQRAMREAAQVLGCDTAAVSLRQKDGWFVRYVHGFPKEVVGTQMNDDDERHAVLAIRTKKPVAVDDAFEDARVNRDHMRQWDVRSVLVVPLIVKDEAMGVMFFNYQQTAFTFRDVHIDFAVQLAASLSLALENARLFERVERELAQRKQAEERIRSLNEALQQRADELNVANEEMEQLATSLALDLRAPLVSLRGLTRVIEQDYGANLPPQARPLFQLIQENADEMEQLTQGLVKLMRVTRQTLRKQETSPTELVQTALTELQPERAGRTVEITVGDLPNCHADPLLLKQVWVNLLANALQATRTREPARIEVGYSRNGEGVIYFVKDNGIGFDMSYAGTIFRAFHGYHHPDEWTGSGIGLAIVENIVRRHNGRVWAESAVDQGATFSFSLGHT